MSQQSTSICHSILIGKCRYEEYEKAEWAGSAAATWDHLFSWFDASEVDPQDAFEASLIEFQRYRVEPGWTAYLNECSTSDGSLTAFKVGITSCGGRRMEQHDNHPLLHWVQCRAVNCGSKRTAQFVENFMLAASAHAGMWLGGEWIAGKGSLTPLAVANRKKANHTRKSARRQYIRTCP